MSNINALIQAEKYMAINSFFFQKMFNDLCYVCTELLSYGMRILNPSIQITTDGALTTKATCSELHRDLVSNANAS